MNELFIRRQALLRTLGIGRTTLYRWIALGEFPAPVRLGPGAVAWRVRDVEAWAASREPTTRGRA